MTNIKMHRVNSTRSVFVNSCAIAVLLLSFALPLQAQSARGRSNGGAAPEQRAARYFDSIRKSPPQMLAFLLQMPKGADLHNHLSGSIYAETYVQWAAAKGLCVNQSSMALSTPPCDQASGQ